MNEFLSSNYLEGVHRLALSLEPIDAERGTRVAHPIRVAFDEEMRGLRRPEVTRHDSCLHTLLYTPDLADRVRLRLFEDWREFVPVAAAGRFDQDLARQIAGAPRRYVPRRISFPILTLADAEQGSHRLRVRRPLLYPGAAYDLAAGMTGLRGRVERAGSLVRWVRVVATLPDNGTVIGRAHGDDRGEFLLIVSAAAGSIGDLTDPLTIRITVSGPATAPVPVPADAAVRDPLWDLPEEVADALDPDEPDLDEVSSGVALPEGYTATVQRDLNLRLGRLESVTDAFILP